MAEAVTGGGCLCGAIRYHTDGLDDLSLQHLLSGGGAPVVAWLTFPTGHFSLVRGVPAEFHSTPRVTPDVLLHLRTVSRDRRHHVEPRRPRAFPPTHHSWLSDSVGWIRFGDGLPGHQDQAT
jgi:hypothetical protein